MPDREPENNRDALMERAMLDGAAFGTLYDMYYEKVFRYCVNRIHSRQVAEDIIGAVFLSASQNISKFRGKTRTEFLDWLFVIAAAKIKIFSKGKQPSESMNSPGQDDLPDNAHKEKLRSKILSSFNQPQPAEIPYLLLSFTVIVCILVIAGFIFWLYPSNILLQKIKPVPQKSVEANIPQPIEKTRLEKIKQFAAEKNVAELLNILRSDDLSDRLLAAKFLAEITESNAADFLKLAITPLEPNNASEMPEETQDEKNRTIIIAAVDKKTKNPLSGVDLEFQIQDDSTKTQTGENGRYSLTMSGQMPDRFALVAKKPGYANMRFNRHSSAEQEISLPEKIVFEMSQIAGVGGFVENKLRQPVENAEIRIYAGYEFDSNMPFVDVIEGVRTDANGFWKCSLFPQDAHRATVIVKHADYALNESSLAAVEQLKSFSNLTILERGVDVVGTVFDLENRPLSATIIKGSNSRRQSANCDNAGKFQFDNVPAGTETFVVQCSGFAPQIQKINVEPNMPAMIFTLAPAGNIRARIIDVKNAPLKDVYVRLKSWRGTNLVSFETHTDANGFFQWIDAPTDEAVFAFSKQGYISVDDFKMKSENDYVILLLPADANQSP
ncbi:MAG: carboxypeptidase regulatory-like domain-containing protein [Phycisphaerae bacterium]|jgi:RNA polymerase sigma-70 factor (ECF subfamily)